MNNNYDIVNGKLVKYNGNDEEVYLEDNVTEIGEEAFKNNKTLKSIIIPFARLIGDSAFKGCMALEKVVIMGNLTEIGKEAFSMCINLKEIHLPKSINKIGSSAFFSCKNLDNVKLPTNLYEIAPSLFENCSSLKNLTMPNNVDFINFNAFNNTSLEVLIIPSSVRKIYAYSEFNETPHKLLLVILNHKLYVESELNKPGNWRFICLPVDNVDNCITENDFIYKELLAINYNYI